MAVAYFIVSALPIALLGYVWYLDRLEHEPLRLVAGVFIFSAAIGTLAAAFIEEVGGALLQATSFGNVPILGDFLYFFFVVALVEEFCKRFPVMRLVWNDKEFNHRFDAILYCIASAIGFAVAENIMYISMFGGDIAIGRLIPVHAICGLFMGYYLGCAKICERGGNQKARWNYLVKSLAIPTLIHGAWDFCVSVEIEALEIGALLGIVVLTIFAFTRLKKYAKFDAPL